MQQPPIPAPYRIGRLLALLICVPAALVLAVGVFVPAGAEVLAVVQGKTTRDATARGIRWTTHVLGTDRGDVDVSEALFAAARSGDTLALRRGAVRLGARPLDQRVRLLRDGRVVESERPTDAFAGAVLLWLLSPLLAWRPYERWKESALTKVRVVMVPPVTALLGLVVFLATR